MTRMTQVVGTVMLALGLVLLSGQGSAANSPRAYREITVDHGGTIRGKVRLVGSPPALAAMPIEKDGPVCGSRKPSPRLKVGSANGVGETLIYLDGIAAGKKFASSNTTLEQRGCEYLPHLMILPEGAPLMIVNDDPILHNVHTYVGVGTERTVFNIAQPLRGHQMTVKSSLFSGPGIYSTICDAGHPWMSATIVVAANPYYVVTDADGNYSLENVPPGTYRVRMWHEGIKVEKTIMEGGKPKAYQFEAPYESEKEVVVQSGGSVAADFDLVLK